MNTACPYCGVVLEKIPKANCKCPHCRHTIYVRKKRPFFDRDLLTEEQALVSDEFVMLNATIIFQATKELYEGTQKKLSTRFGTQASWDDVVWSLYAQYAMHYSQVPDFDALSVTYACMAAHMHRCHKPFAMQLSESYRYKLMYMRQLGFKLVDISEADYQECQACKPLKGQSYKITDELIKHPPLPPADCTCVIDKKLAPGYCICALVGNPKGATYHF